jgi:hypothetical protein
MDPGTKGKEEEWEESERSNMVECPIWAAQRKGFDGI